MPRKIPASGDVQVVFAVRTSSGSRAELVGTLPKEAVLKIWQEMNAIANADRTATEGSKNGGNGNADA